MHHCASKYLRTDEFVNCDGSVFGAYKSQLLKGPGDPTILFS